MLPYEIGKDYEKFIYDYSPVHRDLIHKVSDAEKAIFEYLQIFITDRTKKFPHKTPCKIVTEIPEGTVNKTFGQLVDERAEQIKEEYKDRELVLMWSGGLDSTTAFYALTKIETPLTIHVNHHAINEYPLLAAQLLSGQFKNVKVQHVQTGFLGSEKNGIPNAIHPCEFDFRGWLKEHPTHLVITGEIGDQLFGSAVAYGHSFKTRQEHYRKRFDVVGHDVADALDIPILNFLNKPARRISFAEYMWAVNFTCKYQNVQLRMGSLWRLSPLFDNCYHFFDTDDFQRWSMQNFEKNASYQSQVVYKQPLREYIINNGGDKTWALNKRKLGSLCQVMYK